MVLCELEGTLLTFAQTFRIYVLTESRMINIGHSMIEDPEKDDVLDSLDGIYNVSTRALDCLANLAGYQTM